VPPIMMLLHIHDILRIMGHYLRIIVNIFNKAAQSVLGFSFRCVVNWPPPSMLTVLIILCIWNAVYWQRWFLLWCLVNVYTTLPFTIYCLYLLIAFCTGRFELTPVSLTLWSENL
jgi:hypothetical protein